MSINLPLTKPALNHTNSYQANANQLALKHITISYSLFYSILFFAIFFCFLFPKTCPKPFHPHPSTPPPFPSPIPPICLHRSILIQNGPNEGRPLTQTELLQFQSACVRPTLHQCPPPSLLRDPTYRSPVWCLFTRVTDPWGVGQAQEKHPSELYLFHSQLISRIVYPSWHVVYYLYWAFEYRHFIPNCTYSQLISIIV